MNISRGFQRKKENFNCENCEEPVIGDGYTNHCPKCLFSKHVDINPGDRESGCRGLMNPDSVIIKNGNYSILHICQKCHFKKINKISKKDDFDKVINLSRSKN